uniref:DUF4599 domain-containing protein n=1 Tax=Myotis lucifugus TaxID=59463 RepID=G1QG92_MYOLU
MNTFLKSLQDLYQSFCGEPLDCYCTITYLCVLWLLLLFFCLLVEVPFTLTFWENEYTKKHHQGRAKRRRKGFSDWRYYKREEEEKKMLLSVLKSSLGQHHDSTHFRQLLCPDPSCEVCNDATAEMDQLLFSETLQGATPSVSPLASAAPVTESLFTLSPAFSAVPPGKLIPPPLSEPFPPPLSNLSPNPVTLLGDFPSPTPSVHSLTSEPLPPLESKFTVDDSPFQTLSFPSLPPHDTLPQTDLRSCPQTDLDFNSPPLPIFVNIKFINNKSLESLHFIMSHIPMSGVTGPSLPLYSQHQGKQEHVFLHLPETGLWGDSVSKHMEASSHSFLGLNVQELLERQIKRKAFQILEKNSLQLLDIQNTIVPQTGWNIEDKPEQLRDSQELFYVKTLEENLQQKYSQLFWGLPSLHSESLVATFLVSNSSSPLETRFVLFNHQGSPSFPHFHFLPLNNVDPQHLPQIKPQAQYFTQVQPQPQPHFQSQLAILPSSSSSQIRDCGVSFNRSQNESDSNILNENQHLGCHMLQMQQESLQGLVPVLQKAQDATCPQAPNLPLVSQSSHAYVPVSIITTLELSFLDPNTRQVLEAHIIRFRMNQRWGLPLKVIQSIKLYTAREGKTWPLPQFDFPSSATHISN